MEATHVPVEIMEEGVRRAIDQHVDADIKQPVSGDRLLSLRFVSRAIIGGQQRCMLGMYGDMSFVVLYCSVFRILVNNIGHGAFILQPEHINHI